MGWSILELDYLELCYLLISIYLPNLKKSGSVFWYYIWQLASHSKKVCENNLGKLIRSTQWLIHLFMNRE